MFKDRWSARIFYFTNSFSDHSEHVFNTYNLHGTKYRGYHCEPEIHIYDLMKQLHMEYWVSIINFVSILSFYLAYKVSVSGHRFYTQHWRYRSQ